MHLNPHILAKHVSYKALFPWTLKSQTKLKDASALLFCLPDAMVLGWCVILRAAVSLKFATVNQVLSHHWSCTPYSCATVRICNQMAFFITIHYLIFQLSKQVKPNSCCSCFSWCQELVHSVLRELLWDFSVLVST